MEKRLLLRLGSGNTHETNLQHLAVLESKEVLQKKQTSKKKKQNPPNKTH